MKVRHEPMQLATGMLTACYHDDATAAADLMNSCDFHLLAEVLSCMTGMALGLLVQLEAADELNITDFLTHFGLTAADE